MEAVQGTIASRLHNALAGNLKTEEELQAEDEARKLAKRANDAERNAKDFANDAGNRSRRYLFKCYECKTAYQREVFHKVQEWADTFPDRLAKAESLVLYGTVGTGKDHLAFAAVNKAIRLHHASAAWRNGRDLMGELRDRISEDKSESKLVSGLEAPDILVLSDPLPVMGSLSAYQADMLYRIIDNRYQQGKLTVVTLNIKDDADADDRLGAPTWDRICDGAWKIECKWPSYRSPAMTMSYVKERA